MDNATYRGFVATTDDALLLFEACRQNILPRRKHRLNENERNKITSGSIFVWDETESGIRRWTDGRRWSPSRVTGCFLSYIELKPRLHEREHSTVRVSYKHSYSGVPDMPMEDGLVKKSLSLFTTDGHKLHLICYYRKEDVDGGLLTEPSRDSRLRSITIPKGLYPDFLSDIACVEPPHSLPAKKRRISAAPAADGQTPLGTSISHPHLPMLLPRPSPSQNQQLSATGYRRMTMVDRHPGRLKHNQIGLAHTIQGVPMMTSPHQRHIMPMMSHTAPIPSYQMTPARPVLQQQQYGNVPNALVSPGHPSSAHVRINYLPNYRSQSNPVPQENDAVMFHPLSAPSGSPTYKRKNMADADATLEFPTSATSSSSSIGSSDKSSMKLPSVSELLGSIDRKRKLTSSEESSKYHPAGLAQTAHTRYTNNVWDCRQPSEDIPSFAH
ncbi:Gluconate transport-inducing protein [Coemansia guatemalensis]|uniref:Gluconate transport-inducing protein n=1 Tax=Coemansia guatemalensis TaxID=2761395 RepID=A0A9W8HU80_9FUNG|nr:Gluconate transport-inducing protein [Coemansia guatemalensis]